MFTTVWEELHFTREMDSLIRHTDRVISIGVKSNNKKNLSFVIFMEIIFVYLTQMIEVLKCVDFCFAKNSLSHRQNVKKLMDG